ncbi:MAG: DNA repair protein RecN (Recombination protein N) [Cognaticolwellia sp.]|jgi:DNA repair protein RecN (Recombination protein N)
MIQRLHIRNYAIIDKVDINFSEKLNIITGETGAGKSIILGALGLIMGNRAEIRILKNQSKKCVIEAHFDILHYDLRTYFEEKDLDYDTELTIRREISPSGKSRAFINDTPVRLEILKELTAQLLDLHQQFDTLDVHSEDFQLAMIDAIAKNKKNLDAYQIIFKAYQDNKRQLQRLTNEHQKQTQEMDFIEFQLEELNSADFEQSEQGTLEQDLNILTNAEGIKLALNKSFQGLSEDDESIVSKLQDFSTEISTVSQYHPKLEKVLERFDGLILEIQDVSSEFGAIAEDTEYDDERIQIINDRLDLLYKLQKKHFVNSVEELLEIRDDLQSKVDNYSNSTGEMEKLEIIISKQDKELREKAGVLTQRRQGVIPFFQEEIHKMLTQLNMKHARLQIELKPSKNLVRTGSDMIAFMFAANKGSRLDYIRNVASGGEMSRLALCTKSLVADAITLPTLIFDEIDTGVSGDVALKMGHILRDLANRHQVISITHTPQIAARADHHYLVYKYVAGETTLSAVKLLEKKERINEIAVMLSGNPPSKAAMNNARELMDL